MVYYCINITIMNILATIMTNLITRLLPTITSDLPNKREKPAFDFVASLEGFKNLIHVCWLQL